MQRLEYIFAPNWKDIENFNKEFLDKGWTIKYMTASEKTFLIVIEKETRKEKLDNLNNLD